MMWSVLSVTVISESIITKSNAKSETTFYFARDEYECQLAE